jgi:hypothetical protein
VLKPLEHKDEIKISIIDTPDADVIHSYMASDGVVSDGVASDRVASDGVVSDAVASDSVVRAMVWSEWWCGKY